MSKEIHLIKNNDKRDWSDFEWIEEFYQFLQGNVPERITLGRGHSVKLRPKQAMAIIWYLQEHFPVFPDFIERCSVCDQLYDSNREGYYSEKRGKHYCSSCDEGNFD
jgi:hypothetical protein